MNRKTINRATFRIIKKHYKFVLLLLLFSIAKIVSLFVRQDMWWDSSVYIGMGKYIYSLGNAGLWEPSRPLVWPLILGFLWKINLDVIFFGKLVAILFSIGIVVLTYLIALKITNKDVAFYSSLFLALFPTFFLFNNVLFSEMPSTFFLLLGIYFFMHNKMKHSGFFMGVAFMTRFFHIFFLAPILAWQAFIVYRKKSPMKPVFDLCLFFLIPVVPYLLLNFYLYKNPFFPFALQAFMTRNTGWVYHEPFAFYFVNMLKENFLVLFSLFGIFAVIKNKNHGQKFVLAIFLVIFSLYALEKHKEMRLLIPVLPFLFILVSIGLLHFVDLFGKTRNVALWIFLVLFFYTAMPQLRFDSYEDNLDFFYEYAAKIKNDDGLWISNPSFILHTNKKADELVYYPLYGSARIKYIMPKIESAKNVMINTCDLLPCHPDDLNCGEETDKFFDELGRKMKLAKSETKNSCRYLVFEKSIS